MRRYSFIFLVFLFSSSLYSQEDNDACVYPVYSVGISPSAFISAYPGVQISQDFGIYKPFSISLESGYIYSTSYKRRKNIYGFRFRPIIKYSLGKVLSTTYSIGIFYTYRFTDARYDFEIDHRDYNYTETVNLEKQKVLKGYGLQLGLRKNLGDGFCFGLNLGFGPGKLIVETNEDDLGFLIPSRSFFSSDQAEGVYSRTILYLNINLSYIIF